MDTDFLKTNRDQVRKLWGKSKEEVYKDIKIVREWVETQKHLPEIPNDYMIEFILVNCKFSIEKTKQHIDMYYTSRDLVPEVYRNLHPCSDKMILVDNTAFIVLIPELTPTFFRIFVTKTKDGDVNEMDVVKAFASGLNHIQEIRLHEDLVMGDVYIFDYSNVKLSLSRQITPTLLKKWTFVVQQVQSNRIKQAHFLKLPSYLEGLMTIFKSLLSKKLRDRIYHHQNIESLTKYVSLDLLPSDYGGKQKSFEELTEMMKAKYFQYKDRFDKLETMKVNEALRTEKLDNDELLGYYGNFKQLETD
ncbi:clavesin-1-like [Diorhabda carinulata]|uniref:clavesin-1-like n=1 Tax=Diorhabda carinulata TaxID=1163345 RepID=UPI0025A2FA83|nr:clavesin-1-like [Diorhabda carinulata]